MTFFVLRMILYHCAAFAYAPNIHFILEKTAKNHGQGLYIVEQEVSFHTENETISMNETWAVENGGTLALLAKGNGNIRAVLYKDGQKSFTDESGQKKIEGIFPDFFESFFHSRTETHLGKLLLQTKIVSKSSLLFEKVARAIKDIQYVQDPFLRLTRSNGVINYTLGQTTPAQSEHTNPMIWIEQDRFVIRHLRFQSQAEISADDYSEFSHEFFFPRTRQITWDNNLVKIRLIRVEPLSNNSAFRSWLTSNSSLIQKERTIWKDSPLLNLIKEFYARFR